MIFCWLQQQLVDDEREAQKELDKLRTNLAKIEESIQMKEETVKKNRSSVSEITRELAAIGSGAAALDGVEQDLISAVRNGLVMRCVVISLPPPPLPISLFPSPLKDKELSDYKEQVDMTFIEEELDKFSQEKQKVKYRVQHLQKELSQLSLQSSARGAIEEVKKQKRSKEETYQLE